MELVNRTALIVFVVLVTGAYVIGTAYIRKPSSLRLYSNAVSLNGLAALAAVVFAVTFPDLAWGWKIAASAAPIAMAYFSIRMLNSTRDEYDARQQRSFVQATVEDDRNNR